MGEHQVITKHLYFCCADAIKVFSVNVLPAEPYNSPTRVRIHDTDMDPKAWYLVDADRVKPTKAEAIWAAREALDTHDREISQEMQKLQSQRDEIANLLCIGDPENDGS